MKGPLGKGSVLPPLERNHIRTSDEKLDHNLKKLQNELKELKATIRSLQDKNKQHDNNVQELKRACQNARQRPSIVKLGNGRQVRVL